MFDTTGRSYYLSRRACVALGFTILFLLLLVGCASIPPVGLRYYLPKTSADVTVVRLLGCQNNNGDSALSAVDGYLIRVNHVADVESAHVLHLNDGGLSYGGLDHTLTFFDDGRLKSVDAEASGPGGSVLKSAAIIAAFVPGIASLTARPQRDENPIAAICEYIDLVGAEADKMPRHITLRYTARLSPTVADKPSLTDSANGDSSSSCICSMPQQESAELKPDFFTRNHIDVLKGFLGTDALDFFSEVALQCTDAVCRQAPIEWTDARDQKPNGGARYAVLVARQPVYGVLSLEYGDGNTLIIGRTSNDNNDRGTSDNVVFKEALPIAQWGTDYMIPLPYPKLFGKSTFSAKFSGNGSLTTIGYSREGGSGALAEGVGSLADTLAPPTTSEQAAQVKAEADLIAQQQRLLRCQLKPDECE